MFLQTYTASDIPPELFEITFGRRKPLPEGWVGNALTVLNDPRLRMDERNRISLSLRWMPVELTARACILLIQKTPISGDRKLWYVLDERIGHAFEVLERYVNMAPATTARDVIEAEHKISCLLSALCKEKGVSGWANYKGQDFTILAAKAAMTAFDSSVMTGSDVAKAACFDPDARPDDMLAVIPAQVEILKAFLTPYAQQGSCPNLRLLPPRLVERCSMEGGHTGECVWNGNYSAFGTLSKGKLAPLYLHYRVNLDEDPPIKPVIVTGENDAEVMYALRNREGRIDLWRVDKAEEETGFLRLDDAVGHVKKHYDDAVAATADKLRTLEERRVPFYQAFELEPGHVFYY